MLMITAQQRPQALNGFIATYLMPWSTYDLTLRIQNSNNSFDQGISALAQLRLNHWQQ